MIEKLKSLFKFKQKAKKVPQEDIELLENKTEFEKFKKLGEEFDLPEIAYLSPDNFANDVKKNIFLNNTEFRDKFFEKNMPNIPYYKTVTDLEKQGFDIGYFLTLNQADKDILVEKSMLLFTDKHGKLHIGLYLPTIYFYFDYDEIFYFGNSVYNYFFGRGKSLDFLSDDTSGKNVSIKDLLQNMENMNINDIGIDPINENQYIITGEIDKKNKLLTQRPILKDVISDIFNEAMTMTNIDSTTEFPTITGLLKLPIISQSGIHITRTFRINFIKVKVGYTASIRRFMNYEEIEKLGLDGLNYSAEAQELINEAIKDKSGINMILGETNSGKSTLLAAILNRIYKTQAKILSIENPIEIKMPYLQIDLSDTETADEKFKMTKEKAQKGILRHNPNVILMSEIRTSDEIDFFAGLGLRGHMALATLHAGSIENAIDILLKVANEYELKSICNLFVHQELLSKKCQKCNGEKNINDIECENCQGTGSKGVVPVYEIMKFNALTKSDSLKDLKKLKEDGKIKYISKITLAKELYAKNLIFSDDYERILKNNIEL